MSNTLRKKITIRSNCSLALYGGTFGPISSPFYETIPNIARLICDGIEVYEETPQGKVRLTMSNFDKFEADEARIEKEKEAARVRAQEEQVKLARVQQEAREKAQREQRAREEQQRNNQRNNNKQNQKNNNQQQQQNPVVTDVIVEE